MKIISNLDLNGNQLQNLRVESLSSDPRDPKVGLIYFNTSSNNFRYYSTDGWRDLGNGGGSVDGVGLDNIARAILSKIKDEDNHSYCNRISIINPNTEEIHVYDYVGIVNGLDENDEIIQFVRWMHTPMGKDNSVLGDTSFIYTTFQDQEQQIEGADTYLEPNKAGQGYYPVNKWFNTYLTTLDDFIDITEDEVDLMWGKRVNDKGAILDNIDNNIVILGATNESNNIIPDPERIIPDNNFLNVIL